MKKVVSGALASRTRGKKDARQLDAEINDAINDAIDEGVRGALSIYGDEPGILVQRSRINVRLRGIRTFIRDATRAEVAP